MGKKGQKGQKGFTIASKSNHSNQSFVCRRRKSTNKMLLIGGAIVEGHQNLMRKPVIRPSPPLLLQLDYCNYILRAQHIM